MRALLLRAEVVVDAAVAEGLLVLVLGLVEEVVVVLEAFMSLGSWRCWLKRSAGCMSMCCVLYMLLLLLLLFLGTFMR